MLMSAQAAPRAALPLNSLRFDDRYQHRIPTVYFSRTLRNNSLNLNFSFKQSRVTAQATSGSDFNELAGRLTEDARKRATEAAKSISEAAKSFADAAREWLSGFPGDRDLKRKFREAAEAANERLGDFGYETKKRAERFNRKYKIRERVDEAADFVSEQARKMDREFGISQRGRAISMDFRRNWPTYKRQLTKFLDTPLGRSIATLAFLWFALSGWLFRIIILGTWVLPFAAPFLIGAVARNTVIEGACPACKRRFIGNRNQVIQCMNCRAVVWQPRQDFSKGSSDPEIIDIEIDDK